MSLRGWHKICISQNPSYIPTSRHPLGRLSLVSSLISRYSSAVHLQSRHHHRSPRPQVPTVVAVVARQNINPFHLQITAMVNNSDSTFFTQLILWTTANGISMISTWALLISILRIPKARSSPFNLYLVFSILPDAYKNLSGFIANLTNMLMDEGSPNACTVIGWNDVYWWCANLWMSFVVFMELHKMLGAAKRLQRHTPPTIPQIIKKSLAVHVVSIIMATLTLLPVDFIPKATPNSGCEAYPEPGHRNQTIFYFAFFLPVTAIAPTMFVTCLFIDIWWRKLLPINGKTRSLLFYFARLLLVIYVVAIAVIISFVFGGWVQAIAFVVFNLVGFFSVCLALMKKDVRRVWIQLWTCQDPTIEAGRNQSSYSESTHFENDSRGDNAKTVCTEGFIVILLQSRCRRYNTDSHIHLFAFSFLPLA